MKRILFFSLITISLFFFAYGSNSVNDETNTNDSLNMLCKYANETGIENPFMAYRYALQNFNKFTPSENLSEYEQREFMNPIARELDIKSVNYKLKDLRIFNDRLRKYYANNSTYKYALNQKIDDPFIAYVNALKTSNMNAPSIDLNEKEQRTYMLKICNEIAISNSKHSYPIGNPPLASEFYNFTTNYYRNQELSLFRKRISPLIFNGYSICDILSESSNSTRLSKNYLYTNSSKNYSFSPKIMQILGDGKFLIDGDNNIYGRIKTILSKPKAILISTNRKYANEDNLIPGYYIYLGTYEYINLKDKVNTVHHFKEVSIDDSGFFFFNPYTTQFSTN